MINLIRSISAASLSIAFTLLMFRIFGEISHRKAVAVVFMFGAGFGLFTFIWLTKYELNTKAKRMVGMCSIILAAVLIVFAFSNGIGNTVSEMTGRYFRKSGLTYWLGLLITGFLPCLAFRYETLVMPIADWLSARDVEKN